MEITFKADKKHRDRYFSAGSFAHPAKMMLPLQRWIIEKYSKPGHVILDPMAGCGTVLIACTMGRHVICVELEQKFLAMQRDNWTKIQTLGPEMGYEMGMATILQGDARNLPDVLADVVITSPPYAGSKEIHDFEFLKNTAGEMSDKYKSGEIKGHFASKEAIEKSLQKKQSGYPEDPDNVGNLPYGKLADVIMTSPPYAEGLTGDAKSKGWEKLAQDPSSNRYGRVSHPSVGQAYSTNDNNIGNLPYGKLADVIMTSPPYAETGVGDWQTGRDEFQQWVINELATKGYVEWKGKRYTEKQWRAMNHGRLDGRTTKGVHKHPTEGYGETPGQLGNLPYGNIDCVFTSPPYEGITGDGKEIGSKGHTTGPFSYGQDIQNIGNLKGESYLSAMLEVYQGCRRVLKPQGLMILVTKNFIREKQEVQLDLDTIKLCEQAGFQFVERHYRQLISQSFWRTIALQKCDHRHGSKDTPKCKLGLQCPFQPEAVNQLRLLPAKEKRALRVEKLCPSYVNSSPELKREDILVFKRESTKEKP